MSQTILPIMPHEATKIMLGLFPGRRMRDVIEKRFGLKGGIPKTLEAIGKEYKITRERVRQIEADALRRLREESTRVEAKPLLSALETHLKNNGGVMAEHDFFATVAEKRYHPHLTILLNTESSFNHVPENDFFHQRWALNKETVASGEKILSLLVKDLEAKKNPVAREELFAMLAKSAEEATGETLLHPVLENLLHTSKIIRQNPYGEYGLANWLSISPRGVKDKSYLVLSKCGKPMHFREVAQGINKVGWSKKKAHPQTVHNELIKDARFVLVGRGLYALKEWGYDAGSVRDILVASLKKAGKPIMKDDIIKLVLEKRVVKPPTILLNLQNKSIFKRLEDGRYTLV